MTNTIKVIDGGSAAMVEITIIQNGMVDTGHGIAGYVAVKTADGTEIKIIGRYDDPYAMGDDEIAHIAEHIWVNGQYVEPSDGESGTWIKTPSGEVRTEDIAQEAAKSD